MKRVECCYRKQPFTILIFMLRLKTVGNELCFIPKKEYSKFVSTLAVCMCS